MGCSEVLVQSKPTATARPRRTSAQISTPTQSVESTRLAYPTQVPSAAGNKIPIIGIVAHHFYSGSYSAHVDGQIDAYRYVIALSGGAPILIPLGLQEDQWRAIYEVVDGILFPGGVDVDPMHYDETPHFRLGKVDPDLDRAELTLAGWALDDDMPLLGSCRGAQLLNVAAGGSLIQDIPSQWPGALPHFTSKINAHMVTIRSNTKLEKTLGVRECLTNSRHHQAAKGLGNGFIVSATTSDGVIEAIESTDALFCVGVQWHPENLVNHDPNMLKLFEAFVAAASTYTGSY